MAQAVIATTTWYKEPLETRAQLAMKTVRQANEIGYKIVAVDGSPNKIIKEYLRKCGAVVLDEESSGMGVSRRQAINAATILAGPDGIVIWMEPEKAPLVPLLKNILDHMENADLIIPSRKNLDSYPETQQRAEWLGNRAFKIMAGRDLDAWFGPRIFRVDIAPFFLDYKGEYGDKWDSIFVPVLRAIGAGKRVLGVEVDYPHPAEQTAEEEKTEDKFFIKRIEQLTTLIDAIEKESKILGLKN